MIDPVACVRGLELATVQARGRVGVEYDYGHADSGQIGVAAGPYIGQERLQILVRLPNVEGERLQIVERLDRLQALPTGELLKGGTSDAS